MKLLETVKKGGGSGAKELPLERRPYLRVEDVVGLTGHSRAWVYCRMAEGLPFIQIGNRRLIRRTDLDAYMTRHLRIEGGV